ncbi:dopamine receptor 2 [Nematostella vectensis]|uniref:dopamine receptor 2 n=1 Tax=Nematostella vectensis TaxID=45351 RepID=UPI00139014C6|nr:dopamine receptor 2 [Nematostella vectensis]
MGEYDSRNSTDFPDVSSEEVVLASGLLALLIVGTIFGNSLVCAAFYLFRDLRTVTNYFVVSLAIADLLVGFVSMPLWFTYLVFQWPPQNSEIYALWLCFDIATATASIMNLAVISVDRFYAITLPFQYSQKITKKRACLAIVFVWLYAFAVSSSRAISFAIPSRESRAQFSFGYTFFVATASFFVPLPVMIYCYTRIFSVARVQAAKIRELDSVRSFIESPRNGNSVTENSVFINDNNTPQTTYNSTKTGIRSYFKRPVLTSQSSFRLQRRALSTDIKAAKTLAIVMGAFLLCWAPYIIALLLEVSCPRCVPFQDKYTLAKAVKWLVYSNSALNPIIYTALNRAFRDAFKRVLCKFWTARRRNAYFTTAAKHPCRESLRSERGSVRDGVEGNPKTELETVYVQDKVTVL